MSNETRPGVRTSEFWKTLVLNGLGTVQLLFGPVDVNNKYVVIAMAIITGTYTASRGLAKQGIPVAEPAPSTLDGDDALHAVDG